MAIVMLDHIGIVARTWQEARGVLVDQMGFTVDIERAPEPDGSYFAPEGTHNYFVKVGLGQTRIHAHGRGHGPSQGDHPLGLVVQTAELLLVGHGLERFDVLGQPVSPLDVVRRGGRALHAVGEGMAYDGPDGRLEIATPDAPLVAPGEPRLLDADPPVPDLAGGLHVLLHDNCWGTNFPMWWEGPARFAFTIRSAGPRPS